MINEVLSAMKKRKPNVTVYKDSHSVLTKLAQYENINKGVGNKMFARLAKLPAKFENDKKFDGAELIASLFSKEVGF